MKNEMDEQPIKTPEPQSIWLRMECDKCGAAVRTNELSYRKRHCSCIDCHGILKYTDADSIATLKAENERLRTELKDKTEILEVITKIDRYGVHELVNEMRSLAVGVLARYG